MEKRALLAVVLSLLILIIYQEWIGRRYETPPQPPQEKNQAEKTGVLPQSQPKLQGSRAMAPARDQAAKQIRVETDHYVAVFTNRGARLKSLTLKHYRTSVDKNSPPFEMVSSAPGVPFPLGVQFQGTTPFDDEGLMYSVQGRDQRLTGDAEGNLLFSGRTPTGAIITKAFSFSGSRYPIQLEISLGRAAGSGPPGLLLSSIANRPGVQQDAVFEGLLALVATKLIREPGESLAKGKELGGPVSWAGFGYTYFLSALLPVNGGEQKIAVKQVGPALVMNLSSASGGDKIRATLFMGPKDLDILKPLGKELERSIDFGYFGFVSTPLLYVMRFSHDFTGSYGIDIILLTILIKLLLAPLTHKSFVSMRQMQKLQPQMERIKEKFKDDKEKLNKEIMELYRRNKVNPLGGCLPMLLQFPVFIGLYNALLTPIELRHTRFMWIKDLSRPDWESLPFTLAGWNLGIPVLTLLMGASMFVQQWMTPSAGDPNQRRMMLMMPVIFTAMFVTFPAGLTIYWLVNNILTIAQQYLTNRLDR
jgi:YidC/Oxa1 family membrane protein insertase